jgi:hypothetical protein
MDSGKSLAGKQSKPSHFDAAPRGATAKHRFITPEPGMSLKRLVLGSASWLPGMAAARRLEPFMTRYHCSGKQVRFGFWPSIPIGKFTLAQAPTLPPWRLTSKDTVFPPK